jgi:hypothetical protein
MGTRFGAELPGPHPPQEYVDDLRGSFSLRESGSGNDFLLFTDRRMSARWRVPIDLNAVFATGRQRRPNAR